MTSVCAADDKVVLQFETETPRQFKDFVKIKERKERIRSSFITSFASYE